MSIIKQQSYSDLPKHLFHVLENILDQDVSQQKSLKLSDLAHSFTMTSLINFRVSALILPIKVNLLVTGRTTHRVKTVFFFLRLSNGNVWGLRKLIRSVLGDYKYITESLHFKLGELSLKDM